jgi:acid-sensing ion channel, other
LFNDYADHSTIHGVSYMNEKNRSWFEKFWWVFVFSISVLGCGKMIFDAWNINPIIISFTGKPTSIEQVSNFRGSFSRRSLTIYS